MPLILFSDSSEVSINLTLRKNPETNNYIYNFMSNYLVMCILH